MSRLDDLPLLPVQAIGSSAAPPWDKGEVR